MRASFLEWPQVVEQTHDAHDATAVSAYGHAMMHRSIASGWIVQRMGIANVQWVGPESQIATMAAVLVNAHGQERGHRGLVRMGDDGRPQTIWTWSDALFSTFLWRDTMLWRMWCDLPSEPIWWNVQGPILWTGSPDRDEGALDCMLESLYRDLSGSMLDRIVTRNLLVTWDRPWLHLAGWPSIRVPPGIATITAHWPRPLWRSQHVDPGTEWVVLPSPCV